MQMLNKSRRTEIQIETHDITIIRTHRRQFSTYCSQCQEYVSTFTTEQMWTWLRSIQNGEAHLIEPGQGAILCGNSPERKRVKENN